VRLLPKPGPTARVNAWVFAFVAITQALLALNSFHDGDDAWAFASVAVAVISVAYIAAIVTRERRR
jgi:hypothetical protein